MSRGINWVLVFCVWCLVFGVLCLGKDEMRDIRVAGCALRVAGYEFRVAGFGLIDSGLRQKVEGLQGWVRWLGADMEVFKQI